jgi:hypothetical protein
MCLLATPTCLMAVRLTCSGQRRLLSTISLKLPGSVLSPESFDLLRCHPSPTTDFTRSTEVALIMRHRKPGALELFHKLAVRRVESGVEFLRRRGGKAIRERRVKFGHPPSHGLIRGMDFNAKGSEERDGISSCGTRSLPGVDENLCEVNCSKSRGGTSSAGIRRIGSPVSDPSDGHHESSPGLPQRQVLQRSCFLCSISRSFWRRRSSSARGSFPVLANHFRA